MWSGGSNSEQWGNRAMSFMSMPHEQVDWASLAQQWIKMKEEAPQLDKEEGGEAPMDITKDDSAAPTSREHDWMASPAGDASVANWGAGGWTWDQANAWMQWAGATPAAAAPDMAVSSGYTTTQGYTTIPPDPPSVAPPAPVYSYNPPVQPPAAAVDSYTRGYWTSNTHSEGSKNSHSWESSGGSSRKKNIPPPQVEAAPELDAAKRRALPAWIREGLEKMEREKQKKAEQDRLDKLKKEGASELPSIQTDSVLGNGDTLEGLTKSRFDTDSEEDEAPPPAIHIKPMIDLVPTPRRSRFDQSEPISAPSTQPPPPPPKPKFRSKEQILQAVMTDVRRILTQILMDVTTEEIEKAVEETHKQFKKKAPAATFRKTPALASLTGKLGLGIYESDSGSESEPEKVTNEQDSDQELRDRIDKLKNEFIRIEENIEREAIELEEKERNQLTKTSQQSAVMEETTPKEVEDQVQPSREGSSPRKTEKQTLHKTNSEEGRSNNGLEDHSKDSKSKDRRGSEHSKSDKRSESTRSSSSESPSSSSSEEQSSSPSPVRDKKHKRHHHQHHRHQKKDRKTSRYSRSSSRSRSRSKSRSRSRSHDRRRRHHKSSKHSSSRSSRHSRKRSTDRKRRRSSSSSSASSNKYRKSSHRR